MTFVSLINKKIDFIKYYTKQDLLDGLLESLQTLFQQHLC